VAQQAKVVLEDVAKEFATGRQPVVAVDGITLTIHEQEFACLLGPSGCGKSTVLNLVAGFERPTRGRVAVGGVSVTRPGPDRAVVFQEPALFPWLSVLDNITFGPKTQGQAAELYQPLARQYVDLVGLTGFEGRYPAELSGGMKQRVGIARVLVLRPAVLLMDEPFGALDAQTRSLMQELLLRVWEQAHQTVLFITHDVEEALLLADTVYVMTARPGRVKRRLRVDLPRPRTLEETTSATFNALKREVLALIREESLKAARA
jgi:ABC-type nitrate/sulfonate/bicarbonate transport system ATPase subunit